MFDKLKPIFVVIIVSIIVVVTVPFKSVILQFVSAMIHNRDYILEMEAISPNVKEVTCDPSNKIFFLVSVRDFRGNMVPRTRVDLNVKNGVGSIVNKHIITDDGGECIAVYIPPDITDESVFLLRKGEELSAEIFAKVYKGRKEKVIDLGIKRIPIVYIHGYQENKSIFNSMVNYFEAKGYRNECFSYDSGKKVKESAQELAKFLEDSRMRYLNEGLKVKAFDVVCHSMGGLVARAYTCSDGYWKACNVNKLIFLATPHKGSHIAPIGASLYDDDGIKDLEPDSILQEEEFPSMFNKGLNNKIETLNILGQYDEVVASDSASLDEWGIKTEVYNVGENNLTINSILNGSFISAENHKNILSNAKVFRRIEGFLNERGNFPGYLKEK